LPAPAPALLAPVGEHVALQLAGVVGHHDVNAGKPVVIGLRVVAVRPHAAPPSGNADALHGPGPSSSRTTVPPNLRSVPPGPPFRRTGLTIPTNRARHSGGPVRGVPGRKAVVRRRPGGRPGCGGSGPGRPAGTVPTDRRPIRILRAVCTRG